MTDNHIFRRLVKDGYEKNRYAEEYRERGLLNFEKMIFDVTAEHLPGNAKILDLGCGSGYPYDTYFTEKGFELTGVDFSDKQIEIAHIKNPSATYITKDMSEFDTDEKYDLVLALFSIFHVPRNEQKEMFEKIHNWLADDGLFLLTISDKPEGGLIQRKFTGSNMLWSYFNYPTYVAMLEEIGFTIEWSRNQSEDGLEPHNWVLLRK